MHENQHFCKIAWFSDQPNQETPRFSESRSCKVVHVFVGSLANQVAERNLPESGFSPSPILFISKDIVKPCKTIEEPCHKQREPLKNNTEQIYDRH